MRKTSRPDLCKLLGVEAAISALNLGTGVPPSTDAQLQATCTSTYNGCLSGAASMCDAAAIAGSLSSCTSTVGDVSSCVNASETLISQSYGTISSCNEITAPKLTVVASDAGSGIPTAASCATLSSMGCGLFR